MVAGAETEGLVGHERLLVEPEHPELARVRGFIADACARAGTDRHVADRLALAADEVCANIMDHATPASPIEVALSDYAGVIRLTVTDDAAGFDPRTIPPVDVTAGIRRPVGGLGWHLVLNAVDTVDYERVGERNRLTLTIGHDRAAVGNGPPAKA